MKAAFRPVGHFILDAAIEHLAAREGTQPASIRAALRQEDGRLHAQFRLQIARFLELVLRSEQPGFRAMHVIGSTLDDRARSLSDLDLVVHVRTQATPVLRSLGQLQVEMSQAFRALMGRRVPEDYELLDLHVVTDEDVRVGRGFAATLTSIHMPRMALRRREPLTA